MASENPATDTLARVVREAMEHQGFSVLALANATNIPRTTLNRRLRGSAFTAPELSAVARELGIPVSMLWTQVEEQAVA